jgi:hypothetical protein
VRKNYQKKRFARKLQIKLLNNKYTYYLKMNTYLLL